MRRRKARSKITTALFAAIAMALIVAGCGTSSPTSSSTSSSTSASGGHPQESASGVPGGVAPESVTMELRTEVDAFNPVESALLDGSEEMFEAIYDTLVKPSSTGVKGGGALPGMATSWTTTPTSATFHLHQGLTCTDGTSLTPSGIAKTIEYYGNPKNGALYASRIFGPGGFKSVTADNQHNALTITVNKPYTYLVDGMTEVYIVCPNAFPNLKKLDQEPGAGGTGPYKLTSFKRGQSYVLSRRSNYRALPPGMTLDQFPKTITMRVVEDDTTRANLLQTGEVDIGSVLGQDAARLQADSSLTQIEGQGFGATALLFNQEKGHPGADPAVRHALELAVESKSYTTAANFTVGQPINTLYTSNMPCYNASGGSATPGFDLTEARKLLKEDGWTSNGEGKLTKEGKVLKVIVLGYNTQNNGPQYLAAALGKLGAEVKVNDTTYQGALQVLFESHAWDVFAFPYNSPLYVPSLMVNQISGKLPETLNVGAVQNSEYEALAAKASGTTGSAGCQLWDKAEESLLKAYDVKPLTWEKADWFGNGVTFQASYWHVDLRTIRKAG